VVPAAGALTAYVVAPGTTAGALRDALADRVPLSLVPQHIELVDRLPSAAVNTEAGGRT
jgi:hypothetical protein